MLLVQSRPVYGSLSHQAFLILIAHIVPPLHLHRWSVLTRQSEQEAAELAKERVSFPYAGEVVEESFLNLSNADAQVREPDARFTFANERTFLAWIRTALALVAGGVALELLGLDPHPRLHLSASLLLVGTGAVLPGLSWLNWIRSERAMRLASPLPGSMLGPLVAAVVTAAAVLLLTAIALR